MNTRFFPIEFSSIRQHTDYNAEDNFDPVIHNMLQEDGEIDNLIFDFLEEDQAEETYTFGKNFTQI